MTASFKRKIQTLLATALFPSTHKDWYKEKGYGKGKLTPFEDFLTNQRENSKAPYHDVFQGLTIQRNWVDCIDYRKNHCKLDSIRFVPENPKVKSGEGRHIVNFFGRLEYYECNFRDMALQAHATGASIHAFNPPGMNSSTGHVVEFKDLVNAGIAQVNALLREGIHPDNIILQGNCMGAAVAEEVNAHFEKHLHIQLRRINSNSFKSMSALVTYLYPPLSLLKDTVKKLLEYTGWQTKPDKLFLTTSPYKVYMSRVNDQTIRPKARMGTKVHKLAKQKEESAAPEYGDYEPHRQWLDEHAIMALDTEKFGNDGHVNPHELDLYKLKSVIASDNVTAYDFVNRYIESSNQYIESHPQTVESSRLTTGAPYLHEAATAVFPEHNKLQQNIMSALDEFLAVATLPEYRQHLIEEQPNERIEVISEPH
ncbi:SdbB protein (substrate of the Dot/Icm system) [Legionella rubrilucens]|uniref:SdbB protein (Substrate of the Dot/Icm system) n=2 Tax=Legionella rubrilucens TaxID=458 RepID=A0A0W0XW27_9GAMM|nr:SdbB protein (substrate of the Dot/Icm system) [Legionella rubrilucens]